MGSDLFAPESAPMLPFEFPVAEHDARIRRIRSPRYVDYESGNAILRTHAKISA